MTDYRKVFSKRHVFLAVIHVVDKTQALRNVNIAIDGGADGVFLINHDVGSERLLEVFSSIRESYVGWMGMNFLDLTPGDAIAYSPSGLSGLWADISGVEENNGVVNYSLATALKLYRDDAGFNALYFGGVAFKYQPPVTNLMEVANVVARYVDVVTTSGTRTGTPPDIRKVRSIRSAIGPEKPLAVASGITSKNVSTYVGEVDCFMVATGVSSSHTELDPIKVREFTKELAHL